MKDKKDLIFKILIIIPAIAALIFCIIALVFNNNDLFFGCNNLRTIKFQKQLKNLDHFIVKKLESVVFSDESSLLKWK